MNNFDIKKYLVENKLTPKSTLNENAPGKYTMDNINVSLMNPSGNFINMDDNNQKVRVQFGMDNKEMVFDAPLPLKNLTPMFQNIPKLEREVWAAITNEFKKLDAKLPGIIENVINNYSSRLSEVTETNKKYYAVYNILGEFGDGKPLTIIANTKEEMLNKLNKAYVELTGEKSGPYSMSDMEEDIYMGKKLPHFISDDWASVTDDEQIFKQDIKNIKNKK